MLNRQLKPFGCFLLSIAIVGVFLALMYESSEPFYNCDETRHVVTGVFLYDSIRDFPITRPYDYAVDYYMQYPALGLLAWPPFFYAAEGVVMTVLGPSYIAAKVALLLFLLIACAYLFQLVRREHDTFTASLAVIFLAGCPFVSFFASYVMLEIPTLACGLASIYYFVVYLDEHKSRHIYLASVTAALAALTRHDAAFLLPCFVVLLITKKQWKTLLQKDVWLAAVVSLVLTIP